MPDEQKNEQPREEPKEEVTPEAGEEKTEAGQEAPKAEEPKEEVKAEEKAVAAAPAAAPEPGADKAKEAMAEKAKQAEQQLEKLGVKKTPANICKALFIIGVILYACSSFLVHYARVSATAAGKRVREQQKKWEEEDRGPKNSAELLMVPDPSSSKYNWGFFKEKDGKWTVEVDPEEKGWYEKAKTDLRDKNEKFRHTKIQEHTLKMYNRAKKDFEAGRSRKQKLQDLREAAEKAQDASNPSRIGLLYRYICICMMAVGLLGLLFIGTDIEKAAALLVLGLGIMRMLAV